MDDSFEDFYDEEQQQEHYEGDDVGDENHQDYEQNFGGDVYEDHPENNPFGEEMYHPGTEEEEQHEPQYTTSYESYEQQPNEEEQQYEHGEDGNFENYEEEQQYEDNPYEEQTVEQTQVTEEQHEEGNTQAEMQSEEQTHEDSQFEDFDPYGSYESDNQTPPEEHTEQDMQEQKDAELVTGSDQNIDDTTDKPQQANTTRNTSAPQEPRSVLRERPKSASRPPVQNTEKTGEKKKPSSRPSSNEKKKQFTTVEEYDYKPYYANRQKFYDENEIREYIKEKRRKEKEKLKMRPTRNNNTRKKPYDEEKVKEFMKQKQVNDKKLAEQKKKEEIQKKIGKKDALKRLDEYIHELFTNPPPPEEEKNPKKKKPEMPQFLKDQLGNTEETDGRKRVKEFGKKVRSKLAVDHEKKKKLKEAAEELARELRRRNLHRIKNDRPQNTFFDEETESTNSSVWSLWSAPAKPTESNREFLKGKSEIRDFSFPTPKHIDCTYNDISSIEPQLTEAEMERRKIIDNALQIISSARKAKEEAPVKTIDLPSENKEHNETKAIVSSAEKPISNRMLPQFSYKTKTSPEKKELKVEIEVPETIPNNIEENNTSLLSGKTSAEVQTSPIKDDLSDTLASSPSIVYSEYSVRSDRSLHQFANHLDRHHSESSSLDNSNLDPIVITTESKQKYFNPVEYESFHNSKQGNIAVNDSELSEKSNSEASIIVDSSSENSFNETDSIHEFASFNPSTTIFNDELLKKDNAKDIELHFSRPKEKRNIPIDPNYNSLSIDMKPSPSVRSSSEIEKISYFSKKQELGEKIPDKIGMLEQTRSNKRQRYKPRTSHSREKKQKPALRQSTSSISSLRTSSDYGRESKGKSKTTSNETSSISSDISSNSLLSIENDSETSVLLEEVRKKKEDIKKQVFLSLKNPKNDKLSASYKRNKSRIANAEVDPFNIICTIKDKTKSEVEKERRYKKEKIKEEIKLYKEHKPAGLDLVSNVKNTKQHTISCQTQAPIEEYGRARSIEVQTSNPVDIVYDSSEEIIENPDEEIVPDKFHVVDLDAYMRQFEKPAFIEPEVERLSPDELVERLLDSLQVYEKVFESDVRLTRLLASSGSYK